MFDSSEPYWSDNPNAPKIRYWVYFGEKVYFAGSLIGATFYGIVIVLFFQCLGALVDLLNRAKGGVKWGLVSHTAVMFSLVTMHTAIALNIQSTSLIDNRGFLGTSTTISGPLGYQLFAYYKAIGIISSVSVIVNSWLAAGLSLYRCYIIYARNYWAMVLPCAMYLASVAIGLLFMYQVSRPNNIVVTVDAIAHFGTPFLAISFSLSTLLTLMIVGRLVQHRRNILKAMGSTPGAGGLYKTVATIIIESFALDTIALLLYAVPCAAKSELQYPFLHIFAHIQVIAPFLITLRVANRRAFTSDNAVYRNISSIRFGGQEEPTGDSGTPLGGNSIRSRGTGDPGIGIEVTADLHHDTRTSSEGRSRLEISSRL